MVVKYCDQIRSVLLTSIFICVTLFFFDYNVRSGGRINVIFVHHLQPVHKAHGVSNRTEQVMHPSHTVAEDNVNPKTKQVRTNSDSCSGRYVHMQDLPSRFNKDLVRNCRSFMRWTDMCTYLSNAGLGPQIKQKPGEFFLNNSCYETNQFSLEVIFHNGMKQYKCLTKNSSLASAIFCTILSGLDVGQYLWDFNISVRDASPKELMKWFSKRPEWKRMWGRDHFLVGGRIARDFRRSLDDDSVWGTKLMLFPKGKNMTLLSIASASFDNDLSIPYPTSFHPSSDVEVLQWQERMTREERPYLFSFAGALRPTPRDPLRSELIKQSQCSTTCKFLGCSPDNKVCDDPHKCNESASELCFLLTASWRFLDKAINFCFNSGRLHSFFFFFFPSSFCL
ncbi:xyloglucan galactosyltransferase KATAMARI1-like [Quillaja saponaria]|uniref:Xyloglucan galactosyltransferase KATAMARI1-like n=1 Tax=Quillaja saponaria TaxID=32244 RepID=A0AAD7Q651_QUISA|nr:xyloglucan galactosyltransferase KATAMARI1-like [Quillaja saponaria]